MHWLAVDSNANTQGNFKSSSTAQNKTNLSQENQALFTCSHIYFLPPFDCMIYSWHYLHPVLLSFFQLSCSVWQFSGLQQENHSPSTSSEAPELTPHAGRAQSELTDCWSINTAKNEGTPATASSVDTARRAYAAGTCEKNTCNRNITVCKYLHWVHSRGL